MKLEDIFTQQELAFIDSGEYRPGRAVLDAKLDLVAAMEREACAKVCEDHAYRSGILAEAIRARGQQ